jgi:DnaJ-domain-containing protein 1
VSIGRRLIDLARAELNSLLERAARSDDDEDDRYGSMVDGLSDQELEAELERRRQARQEAEQAAHGPRAGSASNAPDAESSGRRRPEFRRGAAGDESAAVRRAYASLEVPVGSDFEAVRRAYRTLMRKYHPDLHTASPEKQKAANELTQRLTDSYKLLEKKLRR